MGFKHSSGGVTKYYDLEGNTVWIEEKGLESPLIDPFDLLFIVSGIWRIGKSVTKVAARGISALGKASLRQLPKDIVIRLRNVAKQVRKIKKTAKEISGEVAEQSGKQTMRFTSRGTGTNLISETTVGRHRFRINRGHGYRPHRTGPLTHPARAGSAEDVETAIVNDVLRRLNAGENLRVRPPRISDPGPTVTVNGVPIRYNAIELPDGTLRISDYMAR